MLVSIELRLRDVIALLVGDVGDLEDSGDVSFIGDIGDAYDPRDLEGEWGLSSSGLA